MYLSLWLHLSICCHHDLTCHKKVCDTLKSLHREFIWNGKRTKIKHSSLIGECRDGGLKDVDVDAKNPVT